MRRILALVLAVFLCLGFIGCEEKVKRHNQTFIDYFDTVITITGYTESYEEFETTANFVEKELLAYHQLFDVYNTYSGINNLATVNENAGISPVKVDRRIIDLLLYSKRMYELTKGKTDVTAGAVFSLWKQAHDIAAENPDQAELPPDEKLVEAAKHRGFEKLVIDEEGSTVFLTEKGMKIDVGGVAKGYAAEEIAKKLEQRTSSGFALSLGGNLRVISKKPDQSDWTAGVENPFGEESLMTVRLGKKAFVTSGSYVRYYTVDNKRYHHIIDPDTLYPSDEFVSVSVLCDDSAMADSLSTALFCMSFEEGSRLVASLENTEALWVRADGEILYSDGFSAFIIK